MKYELMMTTARGVPVWLIDDNDAAQRAWPNLQHDLFPQLAADELRAIWPLYRGVSPDRLPAVLSTGVDVTPTDAPLYGDDFGKAWEYGGTSIGAGMRLVYALDGRKVQRSFRVLPLDADPAEIERVRAQYPHQHPDHPDELWFSRFTHYRPQYEVPYGYWVPGDAKQALLAVFLLGDDRWREVTDALLALAGQVAAGGQIPS